MRRRSSPIDSRINYWSRVCSLECRGVIVEVTIGVNGKVTDAKILRSIPLLDDDALDAVRQWEYTPTTVNGAPVPVIMTVTVSFTLQ